MVAMPKYIEMKGRVFGRWLVLGEGPANSSGQRWRCRCICGGEHVVFGTALRGGWSTGCRSCATQLTNKKRNPDSVPKGRRHANWKGGHRNRGSLAWCAKVLGRLKERCKERGIAAPTCTPEEFWEWYSVQEKICGICGTDEDELKGRLVVDHDHATGEVRALLCGNCNTLIGVAQESPAVCEKASQFLREVCHKS